METLHIFIRNNWINLERAINVKSAHFYTFALRERKEFFLASSMQFEAFGEDIDLHLHESILNANLFAHSLGFCYKRMISLNAKTSFSDIFHIHEN